MKKLFLLPVFLLFAIPSFSTFYYVSTSGSDANSGTSLNAPFLTIAKAVSKATVPGDTIFVRGGTYAISATIKLSKSGSGVKRLGLVAYQNEKPIIDASGVASGQKGVDISGQYWYIKGFVITKAKDNGIFIGSSNNIVELCAFSENGDSGLQLASGASNNRIINCDSYFNADATQGNADGFAVKLDVGSGNYFYGCRAWQNSDDGWDGYMRPSDDVYTTLEKCWCYRNGYLKSGAVSAGNGNGFKMGGSDNKDLRHNFTLKQCLSSYNLVKGYDQNNNKGSMLLYNCTGHANKPNYGMNTNGGAVATGKQMLLQNCVSYAPLSNTANDIWSGATYRKVSWRSPFVVNASDFVSADSTGITGARQANGELPNLNYMTLARGSDLIDAGDTTDFAANNLTYFGILPDLGYKESNYSLPVTFKQIQALKTPQGVKISWTAICYDGSAYFEIQKQIGQEWVSIGRQSIVTFNIEKNYEFIDENTQITSELYRVKQVDNNGSVQYSSIVKVFGETSAINSFVIQAFPNPATTSLQLAYSIDEPQMVSIEIHAMNGNMLLQPVKEKKHQAGNYSTLVTISTLPKGLYVVKMTSGKGKITYQSFTKM